VRSETVNPKEVAMLRSTSFAALAALLLLAGFARAERVPSRKTVLPPSSGARTDITVPYLTNGNTTLGVWNGVAPLIYGKPGLGNVDDAQSRPVFNLIYYGSRQNYNSSNPGAFPRPGNNLRPGR
jgi:hypothetical protein